MLPYHRYSRARDGAFHRRRLCRRAHQVAEGQGAQWKPERSRQGGAILHHHAKHFRSSGNALLCCLPSQVHRQCEVAKCSLSVRCWTKNRPNIQMIGSRFMSQLGSGVGCMARSGRNRAETGDCQSQKLSIALFCRLQRVKSWPLSGADRTPPGPRPPAASSTPTRESANVGGRSVQPDLQRRAY